ncbi:SGNH/GDSL hydrolase family protein [Salinimicrobium xinjiangense]|uniref:SGNH/GDSL hydrolase family protein n=1 Tax=Salinimicrobium xinjiangense TaxID=438596 RepID=UPI000401CA3C|nr:SGNH/GDSL hydrolase family protein [Salinimicrobium xinjiangense]
MRLIFYCLSALLLISCKSEQLPQDQFFEDDNAKFLYSGRTLNTAEGTKLVTSAASVRTNVYGDTVTVFLKSENEQHHYVAVELNDDHLGRFRILKDTLKFALKKDTLNSLVIYKETEAANGELIFNGLRAQQIEMPEENKRAKIEFIGDSITCGMGADTSETGCDEGEWYDQHSAYFAYGPRVARALEVDFELNCVSGMGIYRNWNDEDQPVMAEVYPYLHLNGNHGKRAVVDKDNPPHIVSIALGTNDFSKGDGVKERALFNSETFIDNYTAFIGSILKIYPETKIALITSPMISKEDGELLAETLKEIRDNFKDHHIEIFTFQQNYTRGCGSHPSLEDHAMMAEEMIPFYQELLKKT